jgi:hypothetical protein
MNIIQIYFYYIKKRSSFALNCFFSSLFVIDILFFNYIIKLIEFINLIQLNNHNLRFFFLNNNIYIILINFL